MRTPLHRLVHGGDSLSHNRKPLQLFAVGGSGEFSQSGDAIEPAYPRRCNNDRGYHKSKMQHSSTIDQIGHCVQQE
jgi:hypothetical protein